VLKGKAGSRADRQWLRRGLVIVQFAASVVLLIGTAIVYTQLTFMRTLDLGIDLDRVLTITGPRVFSEGTSRLEANRIFINELNQIPDVRAVATSTALPGKGFSGYTSNVRRIDADPSASVSGLICWIDTSFAKVYDLKLIAGEGFRGMSGPTPEGEPVPVIPNETAVKAVGFDTPADAIDRIVSFGGIDFRVVGVFRDFHWSSAHEEIENAFFPLTPSGNQLSIKLGTEQLPRTIAAIEGLYTTHFLGNPFKFAFADQQFDEQYRNDQRFATLFSIFAGLAILIACLGLFGLAAFTAQQRTKEIGVRKVLGASVPSIVALLSKDFLILVGVAFLLAAPLAYFAMQRWLENFAYRIAIGPDIFVLTSVLIIVIALATISFQSVKAALSDPVKSLHYE
jgi:putative ABC transport system permease protein